MIRTQKVILPLLFLANCITASGQNTYVETGIRNIMAEHQVVGLSVAVVKDGQIVYTGAFGKKNIENDEPLTEVDLFRIASISKSFSATSIMQLVEAKKVSLDDDFSKLIGFPLRNPAFPDKVITLRMVLSHTSSINDSQGYFNLDVINPAKNPDWRKCYNTYAPGEGYQYCNLNYNMAGTVIEKLSGERFDTYVSNHILRPLKLNGGYCIDSLDNALFTTLYEFDSAAGFIPSSSAYAPRTEEISKYVMGHSTPVFSPTGGMKISAPDLARYMIMHMNYGQYEGMKIISRKSARTMQKAVASNGYALGLLNTDTLIEGKDLVGHTGSAYGLYSAMFFHPKEKFGIVVITNGCKPSYSAGFITPLKEMIGHLYRNLIEKG